MGGSSSKSKRKCEAGYDDNRVRRPSFQEKELVGEFKFNIQEILLEEDQKTAKEFVNRARRSSDELHRAHQTGIRKCRRVSVNPSINAIKEEAPVDDNAENAGRENSGKQLTVEDATSPRKNSVRKSIPDEATPLQPRHKTGVSDEVELTSTLITTPDEFAHLKDRRRSSGLAQWTLTRHSIGTTDKQLPIDKLFKSLKE